MSRKKTGINKKCFVCGKDIYIVKARIKEKNYCSIYCQTRVPWNKGMESSSETKKKISESMFQQYEEGTRDRNKITFKANETLRKRTRFRLQEGNYHKWLSSDGYYELSLPGKGKIKEHIMVWENHNGRKLPSGFHIHHKNGNKLDNRIINLELISAREHHRLHTQQIKRCEKGRFVK